MIVIPLNPKYEKIRQAMIKQYGKEKGEQVFWAWVNKEGIKDKVEKKCFFLYGVELKAEDDEFFTGYITTGKRDLVGDIVTRDCMEDVLMQLKTGNIKLDIEHESFTGRTKLEREINKTKNPAGKIIESWITDKGVKIKGVLNKAHRRYAEIIESIKNGFLDAFSIAYIPIDTTNTTIEGKTTRLLNKILLINLALTGLAVNTEAELDRVVVKSSGVYLKSARDSLNDALNYLDDEEDISKKGGSHMSEEEDKKKKEKEDQENKEKETKDKKNKENEKTQNAKQTETKALSAKIDSFNDNLTELKSTNEAQAKEITELKAKVKEMDEVLSAPQFKSMSENMEKEMKAQEEQEKKKTETKLEYRGPMDDL